jgi:hypothetical protein
MSLWGELTEPSYAIPQPGMFLALDNMPVEKYQPIQDGLLLLRTAMFAEGIGDTVASAKWAALAFTEARSQSGTDLLYSFGWLPIPHAVETGDYVAAIQHAYAMSKVGIPNQASLQAFELNEPDKQRVAQMYTEQKIMQRALLFGFVPLAFRLATLRFDRDIAADLATVRSVIEELPDTSDDWKSACAYLHLLFSGQKTWKELFDDIAPYYANNHWALGVLASLGSSLVAPLPQSLGNQISLARDLEKLFKIGPSIRTKLLGPFFIRYWQEAIASNPTDFRTSPAYTLKAYSEAIAAPAADRVKKLLACITFCTNISLPPALRAWFDEDS